MPWWERLFKNNPNRRILEEFEFLGADNDEEVLRPPKRFDGLLAWAKAFIVSPHDMGAVVPSGPLLGKRMAEQVSLEGDGMVIELGGGTGTMTDALLKRGVTAEQLIVIERSAILAAHLSNRFPKVRIIRGDAARLVKILGETTAPVRAVVSSLPLHALPPNTVREIVSQIDAISQSGTRYIQFTFHRSSHWSLNANFTLIYSKLVWRNIPPARVEVFEYRKGY